MADHRHATRIAGHGRPKLTPAIVFNRLWTAYAENGYTLPGPFTRDGFAALQRGPDKKKGRDLDHECGYPAVVTVQDYKELYERGDLAANVVDSLPDECFISYPEVYETEGKELTAGERKLEELLDNENTNFLHYLHRADKASRVGHFGGLLLGLSDVGRRSTSFADPVVGLSARGERAAGRPPRPTDLLYLRCFDESDVTITEYDSDTWSPRYGRPTMYQVSMSDPNPGGDGGPDEPKVNLDVHWTRFFHVADNRTSSEVKGRPAMKQVYNRLLDLRKILGGSAEMFWKGGFPGFAFETFPELAQSAVINKAGLKDEMAAYQAGLQRFLSAVGGTWKSLAPQVADPTAHVLQQVLMVAAVLKMPLRVLLGNESGHLASIQDDTTWNRRVAGRWRAGGSGRRRAWRRRRTTPTPDRRERDCRTWCRACGSDGGDLLRLEEDPGLGHAHGQAAVRGLGRHGGADPADHDLPPDPAVRVRRDGAPVRGAVLIAWITHPIGRHAMSDQPLRPAGSAPTGRAPQAPGRCRPSPRRFLLTIIL